MDGTAVNEIAALERASQKTVEIEGKTFTDLPLKRVIFDPRPSALAFVSLSALVQYVRQDVESTKGRKLFFVIDDINKVSLVEAFEGENKARTTYAQVTPVKLDSFPFGTFMDIESMIIKAKALFLPNADLDEIIATLSTVTKDTGVDTLDNGVSQAISVRVGIRGTLSDKKETKGIYKLLARRIFPEVQQPESEFIFRVRPSDPVSTAIFEADGGAWRITAINNIRDWIESQDLGIPVLG